MRAPSTPSREPEGAGQSLRGQPEDRRQVEEADLGRPIFRPVLKNPSRRSSSIEEEAVIVAFRRHTLLPLDDCLYALQPTIPRLTRSSLHRCLQRHGIGRLPDIEGEQGAKEEVQVLSDRLLPYRYRRGPDGRGETLFVRRH